MQMLIQITIFNLSLCRDENSQLADIFVKKGPYLKMYSTYIREFDKNVALLEEQSKRNSAFGAVVRAFEVGLAPFLSLPLTLCCLGFRWACVLLGS